MGGLLHAPDSVGNVRVYYPHWSMGVVTCAEISGSAVWAAVEEEVGEAGRGRGALESPAFISPRLRTPPVRPA